MNVTYNPKGVGDVLIISLKEGDKASVLVETFGPIAKITNESKNVLGYNLFDAKKHLKIKETGKLALTKELLEDIRQLFKQHHLSDVLDIDLTPKFVVGYVTQKMPHENADKLSVCEVDVGDEDLQIVCGATNIDEGQKVVVAKVGATMPTGLEIKPSTLRGVASNGMICSKKELGLPQQAEEKGIYILDGSYQIGTPFIF